MDWQTELKEQFPELTNKIYGFEHNEGWKNLILRMLDEVDRYNAYSASNDPEYTPAYFVQIKEKFGGLRAYFEGGNDNVYKIVLKYEHESMTICEVCGTKENVKTRSNKGWIQSTCENHKERKQ